MASADKVPSHQPEKPVEKVAEKPQDPQMDYQSAEAYLGRAEEVLSVVAGARAAIGSARAAESQVKYFEQQAEKLKKEIKEEGEKLSKLKTQVADEETKYKNTIIAARENYAAEVRKFEAEQSKKVVEITEKGQKQLDLLASDLTVKQAEYDRLSILIAEQSKQLADLQDKLTTIREAAAKTLGI